MPTHRPATGRTVSTLDLIRTAQQFPNETITAIAAEQYVLVAAARVQRGVAGRRGWWIRAMIARITGRLRYGRRSRLRRRVALEALEDGLHRGDL